MSGRHSRSKGARTERSIVNALRASGIGAVRVPLSGAVGGRFAGDIVLPLMGRDLCVEVKARAAGFRELYSWLTNRDVVVVKADRQEPLVVLRLSLAAEIAKLGDEPPHCFSGLLAPPHDCRPCRDLLWGANRKCLSRARRLKVPSATGK
jgi:hypothetical protein